MESFSGAVTVRDTPWLRVKPEGPDLQLKLYIWWLAIFLTSRQGDSPSTNKLRSSSSAAVVHQEILMYG